MSIVVRAPVRVTELMYGLTEDWHLILDNKYPGYSTYRGKAAEITTSWSQPLAVIIDAGIFISNIITKIITTFSTVKILQVKVWRKDSTWYGIPYSDYNMVIYAYQLTPQPIASGVVPLPIAWGTIGAIILGVIVVAVIWGLIGLTQNIIEIVWGPEEAPDWARWILPAAILAVAGAYVFTSFKK